MIPEHDDIKRYFNCTEPERACFEAGIKLGALFHQFVGVPLNPSNTKHIENAMREAVLSQPYVVGAEVRLDALLVKESLSHFGYCTLEGRMIDAMVTVELGKVRAIARLKQVDALKYPLMWVEKVERTH